MCVLPLEQEPGFRACVEGEGPYRAVPDEQEDLLGLLGPTDDVGEAGGLLRRHAVVGEAALEGGSLHT